MIRFLILPDAATADTRSRAAWTPGDGDTITTHRWAWRVHPTDGRAAMMIPDPGDGVTEAESAALVAVLPGSGWDGDAAPS